MPLIPCRLTSLAGLAILLTLGAGAPAAPTKAAGTSETAGALGAAGPECAVTTVGEWQIAQMEQAAPRREWARRAPMGMRFDERLLKPIAEAEVEPLIHALQPVKLDKSEGWAIRAALEETKLSLDRLVVLVGDLRTVLVRVQSQALIKEIRGMPKPDQHLLAWAERADTMLGPCTLGRFAQRGGAAALDHTILVLEKYRDRLEPLILQDLQQFGRPPR